METYRNRTIAFFSMVFIVEIALVLWVGLGWFLLAETLRRSIIAIPSVYIPILRYLRGSDRADDELKHLSDKKYRWHYVLRIVILLVWVILTIVAFEKANVALFELFI
jgi:hypothetical protein